ncbi:hypothetical protein GGH95_000644 [Coemansia sp. RSA 1836]|nr:hypothetical protein GGH95_000644 [Coemansia sp. RSA 1836]
MLGYSGPEVIELLSDDDSFVGAADDSVLEVVAAPRQNAWPGSTPRANHTSRVINILTPGTPDTPDLPSPSALLGAPRGRGLSSDSGGSRQALTPTRTHDRLALLVEGGSSGIVNCGTLLSRQVALDLPSSPPAIDYTEDLDDSRFLDDIIGRQTEFTDATSETDDRVCAGTGVSEFQFGLESSSLYRRPYTSNGSGAWRRDSASVEYSDAVATEIIDSSDDEAAPEPRQTVQPVQLSSRLSDPSSFRLFSSRSPSVEAARSRHEDVLSVSTDPSVTALFSERPGYPIIKAPSSSSSGSSSGVHSVGIRKESSAEQRRIEAERKRAERAAEKERREREKETQRGISSVNKKQVDQRVLARDMTVVVDPGLLAIFKEPKRATAAPPQPTSAEETAAAETTSLATPSKEHSIFERLREEEIKYRVEETNAACGIRWEMLVRRKWDSRTNLYVPIACPQVCKVKRAAMVVLSSDRFVELLAKNRVETLLEIWRGALATKRLFVAVVGLQKYLRRAAAVETREQRGCDSD